MSNIVYPGKVQCPYCRKEVRPENLDTHVTGNKRCIKKQLDLQVPGFSDNESIVSNISDSASVITDTSNEVESNSVSSEPHSDTSKSNPKNSDNGSKKDDSEGFGKENKTRIRNGCFTQRAEGWNHQDLINKLNDEEFSKNIRYLTFQLEISEGEYPHFQGYIELRQQMSVSSIKSKIFGSKNLHIRSRKGTAEQAAHYCKKPVEDCSCSYCKKEDPLKLSGPCLCDHCKVARTLPNNGHGLIDGKPCRFEWGERSQASNIEGRNRVISGLLEGKSADELMVENPEYAIAHANGIRSLAHAIENMQGITRTKLEVHWLFGWPGAGKTFLAKKIAGPKFYAWPKGASKPNKYRREKAVIIEEWNPNSIDIDSLKCLLDKENTASFDTKYREDGIPFCPEVIIVTSNECPWDLIRKPFDRIAISRRLTTITGFTKPYEDRDPNIEDDGIIKLTPSARVDPLVEWDKLKPDNWM
jgi:hypothetical protein